MQGHRGTRAVSIRTLLLPNAAVTGPPPMLLAGVDSLPVPPRVTGDDALWPDDESFAVSSLLVAEAWGFEPGLNPTCLSIMVADSGG